jgi:hypothetical protein
MSDMELLSLDTLLRNHPDNTILRITLHVVYEIGRINGGLNLFQGRENVYLNTEISRGSVTFLRMYS